MVQVVPPFLLPQPQIEVAVEVAVEVAAYLVDQVGRGPLVL
jgi:hypothetical protein